MDEVQVVSLEKTEMISNDRLANVNNSLIYRNNQSKRKMKKKIWVITLLTFVAFVIYGRVFPQMNIGTGNVVLFSFSVFFVSYGMLDILKAGVRINNTFLVCYFLFLGINNLNISRLQIQKGFYEIYLLLAGPLLFWFIVKLFDNKKISVYEIGAVKLNPNSVGSILICITLALKLIVIMQRGIRLLDANWLGGGTGDQYTVGGITGIYRICLWNLLLLLPRLERKRKIIAVIMAFLFEAVFDISRNNAMMILVYLVLVYAISKKDQLLTDNKVIRRLFIVAVFVIIVFTMFGNYRQAMRGWGDPVRGIEGLLQSNLSNGTINWVYGYTAINYDVMLQCMATARHPMTLYSFFSPYIRLLSGASALSDYHDAVYHIKALNGFNASTMFGPMVYEMGVLYVIQVFLLALQVGILGWIARKEKSDGHYAYLMTFGALAVFGNFYSIPIYLYISIAAIVINLFLPVKCEET